MANAEFHHVHIAGLSVALPTRCFDTKDIATDMDEKAVRRFVKSTGVEKRYLSAEGQTTSDLCYVAALNILEKQQIDRNSIDALIFITQNPDYKRPSTAIILQERLKLSHNCMAFDINLGCSGYVYGLYMIAGMIESGAVQRALLLTGDVNFDLPGELLFGDGGSATLLERGEDELRGLLKSDGSGFRSIYTPEGGQRHPVDKVNPNWDAADPKMNGSDVFEFSITQVPALFEEYKDIFHTDFDEYDYVILHQANLMILKHIINKLHIPADKAPISIQKYGNVSSASIPISIADLCSGLDDDRELKLLLSGFGVGLSLGVVSVQVSAKNVYPILYSDYIWDEEL